jgi:hypothetical protein
VQANAQVMWMLAFKIGVLYQYQKANGFSLRNKNFFANNAKLNQLAFFSR